MIQNLGIHQFRRCTKVCITIYLYSTNIIVYCIVKHTLGIYEYVLYKLVPVLRIPLILKDFSLGRERQEELLEREEEKDKRKNSFKYLIEILIAPGPVDTLK